MKISRQLVEELIEHSRQELPNECCGMIGGQDGVARSVYRARNEFESPLRYRIHTDDQLRIQEKEMRAKGEDVLAIYHSHTKTAAYPSQTDVNEAEHWPEPIYLIVSLQDPDAPDVKGYWLKDLRIADAELVVE